MHFLLPLSTSLSSVFFFFHAPTPPEIYTLSLHDALPILHGWVQRLPAGSLRGPGALGAPLPGGAGGAEEAAAGGAGLLRRGPAERRPRRGADGPEVPRRPQRDPGQTPRARVPSTPGPARAGTGAQASRAAASHAAAPCPPRRGRLDRDRAGECAGGPRPGPARTGVAVALGRAAAADHRGERLGQVHPAG